MAESPTVDEFIRHMQAELDACEDIVDKNERQKRQWQIESSLLLAIEFSTRFKELSKLGQNPLKIVQALSTPNAMEAGHVRISRPAILEVDTTRAIADGFTIWRAGTTVFLCEEIVDKNERQKRQWQIESSLLLAIEFSTRFKELTKLGQNPLKIVQALSTPNADNAEIAKQVIAIAGGMCPHCGASVDADLDFCSACGNYIE